MNEIVLLESQTARNSVVDNVTDERADDILSKVKVLALLPDNIHVTVEMVSNYYEVNEDVIRHQISANREELESDKIKVLKGAELKRFKEFLDASENFSQPSKIKKTSALTIIPRRAILRIGMLLRDSEIAKQIRTYLLNVEENSSYQTKLISLTEQTNSELSHVRNNVDYLIAKLELQDTINFRIETKLEEILNQPLLKIHENMSSKYEHLLVEFQDVMGDLGVRDKYNNKYNLFNKAFQNWTGHKFKSKYVNKKNFWIYTFGIESVEQFVLGVKQGIIVQNSKGNWVSKSGIYSNKIEWKKILKEFDDGCAYCGDDRFLIAEHIIPQTSEKSSDLVYNIIPSCQHCNERKGVQSIKEFYNESNKDYSKERKDKIANHWHKYYVSVNVSIK